MAGVLVQVETTATAFPLILTINSGGGITGQSPTVALRRLSDGYYLDWNDNTFKNSGWTTKNASMTDQSNGDYYKALNALAAGLAEGAFYVAEYTNTGTYALFAADTLNVVTIQRNVTFLRKARTNKVIYTAGNPGTLVLYDDNSTTPLLSQDVTDSSGGATTDFAGSPAINLKGTGFS